MTFKENIIRHINDNKHFFICILDNKKEREFISFLSENNNHRQLLIYDNPENLNLDNSIGNMSKDKSRLIVVATEDPEYRLPRSCYNFITIKSQK